MTRPYSVAFKKKMVERLTGSNAITANQLAKEAGVGTQGKGSRRGCSAFDSKKHGREFVPRRGRRYRREERELILAAVAEAQASGARLANERIIKNAAIKKTVQRD